MPMERGVLEVNGPSREPQPGDVTVCAKCSGVLVFDTNLKVRRPTDLERLKIQTTSEFSRPLAAMSREIRNVRRAARN